MSVTYLDTSALVKLVVDEPESAALRAWLRARPRGTVMVTSSVARVELARAARRHSVAAAVVADRVLSSLDQIAMTPEILGAAAVALPPGLRNLDAIHLATAAAVGSALDSVVAYDVRLLEAAGSQGVPVSSPR